MGMAAAPSLRSYWSGCRVETVVDDAALVDACCAPAMQASAVSCIICAALGRVLGSALIAADMRRVR